MTFAAVAVTAASLLPKMDRVVRQEAWGLEAWGLAAVLEVLA